MQDHELLNLFASTASQEAFTEIVRRYADTVYSAARRQMRGQQAADDVSQAVFIILAQKAGKIDRQTPLSAWLLKTTYFACQDARRQMIRRQKHEKAAAELEQVMTHAQPIEQAQLDETSGELDAALAALSDRDRGAVTLRYLDGKSVNETADALRITPAAAAKRIARALERLRKRLLRRGIVTPAVGLAVVLEGLPRFSASPALAKSMVSAAVSHTPASAAGGAIAKGTLHMMKWIKIKVAAAMLVAAAATAGIGTIAVLKAQTAPPAPLANNPPDAQPGINFNAAIVQQSQAQRSFVGILANGVSFEVMGINENPSRAKPWWKPDGSPLDRAPYLRLGSQVTADGAVPREVAVLINPAITGSKEPADVRWNVVSASNTSSSDPTNPIAKGMEAAAVAVADSSDGVTLRATVASGQWKTEFTSQGNGREAESSTGLLGFGTRSVLFGAPMEDRGKTQIAITCAGIDTNASVRAVVIDAANKEHPCTNMTMLFTNTEMMGEFRTDVPIALIKHWQVQSRPFDQWIEFRHVALHPGQNSKVEIVTSDEGKR